METQEKLEQESATTIPIAEAVDVATLIGLLKRTVTVPPGSRAVWVSASGLEVVPPGKYVVGGLLRGLAGGGRPKPKQVIIIRVGQLMLQPRIWGLVSGDDQLLEAEFDLIIEVADPVTFYKALLAGRTALSLAQLEVIIAGRFIDRLSSETRGFRAADLKTDPLAQATVLKSLQKILFEGLNTMGLNLVRLDGLTFCTVEERAEQMRRLAEIQQRLQDEETRARIKAIQSQKEWEDFLAQLDHEYRLRELMREGELRELEENWTEKAGEAQIVEAHLEQAVGERLAQLEEHLSERIEQLAARVGARTGEATPNPVVSMARVVNMLRWSASLIIGLLSLFNLYGWVANQNLHQTIVSLLGVIVAMLALTSSVWYGERAKGQRRQAILADLRLGRMSQGRRQEIERLVRHQVELNLDKLEANLKETLLKAYSPNHKDIGVAIRALSQQVDRFRCEVKSARYTDSPYLSSQNVSDEDLREMLRYDESLLHASGNLAHRTQVLYAQVIQGEIEAARELLKTLDMELFALRNRFRDRADFIQSQAIREG